MHTAQSPDLPIGCVSSTFDTPNPDGFFIDSYHITSQSLANCGIALCISKLPPTEYHTIKLFIIVNLRNQSCLQKSMTAIEIGNETMSQKHPSLKINNVADLPGASHQQKSLIRPSPHRNAAQAMLLRP